MVAAKKPLADISAPLILMGMVLWFAHEMVSHGKIPFFRDLGTYFYPMRFSLAQSFKAGELPLWDRHVAMGFPLLADFQSATFYPPHILYLVMPFFAAVGVLFFIHYLIAATGGYFLFRRWASPPYLAIIGAVLFTLGGTVVSLTNVLNHFQTAVWLPWVLFLWERFLVKASWKRFLAFTGVSLVQFLAGSPEFYVMSMGILLLDTGRTKTEEQTIGSGKAALAFLAAQFLVMGLAMVQILPTLELVMQSRGQKPVAYAEAASWPLSPLNLINLFFLDKQIDLESSTAPRFFFLTKTPFLISYYLGAICAFGVALWLYYGSRKEKTILLTFMAVFLVVAMGDHTPLYGVLYRSVPLFSLFRFPEKFFFIVYALLIFAIVKGIFCFLQEGNTSRAPIIIITLVWAFFFLLYVLLRINTSYLRLFIAWATGDALFTIATLRRSALALASLEAQAGLTFGILLILVLGKTGKLRPKLLSGLLVLVVFVDLYAAHSSYQYLLNPEIAYQAPRIIAAPDREPDRLLYFPRAGDLHPSFYSLPKEPSFAQFNSLVFANLLPNAGVFYGFDYMQEIDALGRWPYSKFLDFTSKLSSEGKFRLLGALNVKYVNGFESLAGNGVTLLHHFPQYPSWLYQVDHVVPRAYVVSKILVEIDPIKTLEILSRSDFDPLKAVILEKPASMPPVEGLTGQARITRYGNQEVVLAVSVDRPGELVLADSFYPGWRAFVDGKDTEILRANLFFRAVALQPGNHRVEFRYQPVSFRIGLAVSLVTLCAVVIVSSRRNKSRELSELLAKHES